MLESSDEQVAVAEGQRVADNGPENRDQADHGEALHHGAEDVLAAHQPAVEERQSGAGHEQHESRRGEHPGVIAGGLSAGDRLLQGGDLGLGYRGLHGRVGDRRGHGQCEVRWEQEKEQQLQRTTRHEVFRFEFSDATRRENLRVWNNRLWRASFRCRIQAFGSR